MPSHRPPSRTRRGWPRRAIPAAALALLATLPACRESPAPRPDEPAATPRPGERAAPGAEARDDLDGVDDLDDLDGGDDLPVVVVLGDSLAAGSGLPKSQAFPALVEERLREAGHPARVVNAGVSGDTTAGALRRIEWVLDANEADVVVLALGANDGLRGQSPEVMEANLRQLVARSRERGARLLLAGMLVPPNYGPEHSEAFAAVFPRLAADLDVALIPFLLEGVAGRSELNLPDGIHPNAEGQEIVAATVARHLVPILAELADSP